MSIDYEAEKQGDDFQAEHASSFSPEEVRLGRWVGAGAFASALAALDVVFEVLCIRFPLFMYLGVAAAGFWVGGRLVRRMAQRGKGWGALRWSSTLLLVVGVLSVASLSFVYPVINSKCNWRSCGRILGPGLFVSPFPAPSSSCHMLSICVNEYPYSTAGQVRIREQIREMGCPPP